MSLDHSDEESKEIGDTELSTAEDGNKSIQETDSAITAVETKSAESETKEQTEQQQAQTVEEIVGHILMQNQEFQKLLDKHRTGNNMHSVRQQQRFQKCIAADTSDDSDMENNYVRDNRSNRLRNTRREHRLVRANNAINTMTSDALYDNVKLNEVNGNNAEKKSNAFVESFKRQQSQLVSDGKVMKTASRVREGSCENGDSTLELGEEAMRETDSAMGKIDDDDEEFCKYVEKVERLAWGGLEQQKDEEDSPTKPSVWLTKLCKDMPSSPQKCGSLPRSFQINQEPQPSITKSRFLQRDGKPMSERPFTIASDKPAEINLEDMERYASSCQGEGRIAKFPTCLNSSGSTFFCPLEENITDYSQIRQQQQQQQQQISPTVASVHPDHKVYRGSGSAIFRNVLMKAGSRLQGLRATVSSAYSAETLESCEDLDRTKYTRSSQSKSKRNKNKSKPPKEVNCSDVDEQTTGCIAVGNSSPRVSTLYYKQGSSGMGARIAQSDYADPSILFGDKRPEAESRAKNAEELEFIDSYDVCDEMEEEEEEEYFYEKSFETIEDYVDADVNEAFRDSAIFSDSEEPLTVGIQIAERDSSAKRKVPPPVPAKKKYEIKTANLGTIRVKPSVAEKPSHLRLVRSKILVNPRVQQSPVKTRISYSCNRGVIDSILVERAEESVAEDVSAGQSQAGWVKKMIGQLQAQSET